MRAVVAHGAGDFRVEEMPDPPLEGGAVVSMEAAGVCAADRMIYKGDSPWVLTFPFIPGHENVGTVVELDADAGRRWGVAEGDMVVNEVMVPSAACSLCRRERFHLCRDGRHIGSSLPGGWAERMAIPPEARVWRVPTGLVPEEAVAAEPLACGIHGIERADPAEGETIVISGIGAIGAGALAYVAAVKPVRQIVALVTTPERARLARELGATEAIDVTSTDATAELRERTDGVGPDHYVDFTGVNASVDLAFDAIAPGGRITLYGVYREQATIDWNTVAEFKELEIRGGHLAPTEFGLALELLASRAIDGRRLVTASYPLAEVRSALEESRDEALMTLKTILRPNA